MSTQRFLFNTSNRRIISYNPLLARRSDMVECDSEGRVVAAEGQGLTPPTQPTDTIPGVRTEYTMSAGTGVQVNPVAQQLNEDEFHTYCMTKGLSSLNKSELTEIATHFGIMVIDDDTNDEIKERIEEARQMQ